MQRRCSSTFFAIDSDFLGEKRDSYGWSMNQVGGMSWRIFVPPFSLRWKSDESTKHYLTQMLLAVNWRNWQEEKDPRMRMRVQGRLMQARFIEIRKDFAKNERSDTFLIDRYVRSWLASSGPMVRRVYNTVQGQWTHTLRLIFYYGNISCQNQEPFDH